MKGEIEVINKMRKEAEEEEDIIFLPQGQENENKPPASMLPQFIPAQFNFQQQAFYDALVHKISRKFEFEIAALKGQMAKLDGEVQQLSAILLEETFNELKAKHKRYEQLLAEERLIRDALEIKIAVLEKCLERGE